MFGFHNIFIVLHFLCSFVVFNLLFCFSSCILLIKKNVKCYLVKKRKENIDNGMDNFLFEYYNKKIENFIFFIYIIKQNAY